MHTRSWLVLLLSVFCLSAKADIIEQHLDMPDGLGKVVIYRNSATKSPSPGVMVIHEWWGFNDYARNKAKSLAELGFSAIAVDMYGHGKIADHPDSAKAFMQAAFAESDKMHARFNAAKSMLKKLPYVDPTQIFAIGYCFGGAVVLGQARMGSDLAGVASFHGLLGTDTPASKGQIRARIFVATGGADPFVPAEQVSQFVAEMANAGAEFELMSFPGVKHSFTTQEATANGLKFNMPFAYDAYADKQSWDAFLRFIAHNPG